MRRRCCGTNTPRAVSTSTPAVDGDAARCRPDQPGDDVDQRGLAGAGRPNSAVSRPPLSKRASSAKSPSRWRDVDRERHSIVHPAGRRAAPAASEASSAAIEMAIEISGQPQRAGIAARHLGEGVDRRRQRLRLAGDVGDEGDGGAELAHRLGEAQDHAGDDAGQDQRQGDGQRTPRRGLAPSVPAASSSLRSTASIDSRIARTISGKPMTAAGQRRAGPAERRRRCRNARRGRRRPARGGRTASSSR